MSIRSYKIKPASDNDALHDALDIAIVGIGGLLPGSKTLDDFWQMISSGGSASRKIPENRWPVQPDTVLNPERTAVDKTRSIHACLLNELDFTPEKFGLDSDLLQNLDPLFHLTLLAGHAAIDDMHSICPDKKSCGIILGNIILPTEYVSKMARQLALPAIESMVTGAGAETEKSLIHPLNIYPAASPATLLARSLQFEGSVFTIDAACASSLYAIKLAVIELMAGRLDLILTGGVSRPDCMYTQMGFSQLQAISPSGICSPFDRKADGLVVGEGAAMVVLKRLPDAVRDGDFIYGVIRGIGISNDVGGSIFAPDKEGQTRALRRAYQQAGWTPGDIDLVECHGTGTPVGDAVEFSSMQTIWQETGNARSGSCVIGSVKSNIGHLLTAAGGAGLLKILLALKHRTLPPSAHFTHPSDQLNLNESAFRVLSKPEPWLTRRPDIPRRAAVSAFGFGGINAHVLIEEFIVGHSTDSGPETHVEHQSAVDLPTETTVSVSALAPFKAPPIAIVSMAAAAGPWTDLQKLQNTLFEDQNPRNSRNAPAHSSKTWHWNGLDRSEWFRTHVVDPKTWTGYSLGRITIPPGKFRIPPAELGEMLPQQLLMLKIAADAVEQGDWREEDAIESGVFIGIGLDLNTTNFQIRWCLNQRVQEWINRAAQGVGFSSQEIVDAWSPPLTANRVMGALGGIVAARISRALKVGGAGFTVSADEISGSIALATAVKMLQNRDIKQALVGAVDLNSDWRALIGSAYRHGLELEPNTPINEHDCPPLSEGAVVLILKRLEDAQAAGDTILAVIDEIKLETPVNSGMADTRQPEKQSAIADSIEPFTFKTKDYLGDIGAAAGLFDIMLAVTALHHRVLPRNNGPCPLYWLRNKEDGPRKALIKTVSFTGNRFSVLLEEHEASSKRHPALPLLSSATVSFQSGETANPLTRNTEKMAFVYPGSGNHRPFLGREPAYMFRHILDELDRESPQLKNMFEPELYWCQPNRPAMEQNVHGLIVGHVMYGFLISEILRRAGVIPDAIIGYSLGESTGLIGQKIWPDRDRILKTLQKSSLFIDKLAGPCTVLADAWHLPSPEWRVCIIDLPEAAIRKLLEPHERLHLMIVNTPDQCVIGGHGPDLTSFLATHSLVGIDINGVSAAHIPELLRVSEEYRNLHLHPVTNPESIQVYSGAWAETYPVSTDRCADAILAHATGYIDFVQTIEAAYRDGIRHFVEIGPGSSCTAMIHRILQDRDCIVDTLDKKGLTTTESIFSLLERLQKQGRPVDIKSLSPQIDSTWKPPAPETGKGIPCRPEIPGLEELVTRRTLSVQTKHESSLDERVSSEESFGLDSYGKLMDETGQAVRDAHQSFLELSRQWMESMHRLMAFQTSLLPELISVSDRKTSSTVPDKQGQRRKIFLDRDRCLEFAVGSIGKVLGAAFAEVDSFPTRVRLPDEPLMLVDRILKVEGEALSMTSGSVVTEHDVLPGAWYLDQGKCPVCITVEAGQADLFLSAYLGIDFQTRGIRKYRLLDAEITMHRDLPKPNETIQYDIRISQFFRQGDVWLFHFEYDATVSGKPMLTMRNGCAGFFSDEDLGAGQGIVKSRLDTSFSKPRASDCTNFMFTSSGKEVLSANQIEALRHGNLAGCFGAEFHNLNIKNPPVLPGGRMHLIDRILELDTSGGTCGLGKITAEADIAPDAWFLTCHFVDDMVMPGTLMYECCFHTFRILLMRMGWLGERDRFAWDPKPGVTARLKCRGQVTPNTQTAAYEVCITEIGLEPVPYAIADAVMFADGRPVVEIRNMSVQLNGLTRSSIEHVWNTGTLPSSPVVPSIKSPAGPTRPDQEYPEPGLLPALYTKENILAFSNGKPSKGYGGRYKPFDDGRFIARLPGPPYQFLDRVVSIQAEPWKMAAGGQVVTEYDLPASDWFIGANGTSGIPYAVLLEIALQPCGWFSAFMGSALHSDTNLHYRNLEGHGVVQRYPLPQKNTLAVAVKSLSISHSGGMILQRFAFKIYDRQGDIYTGETNFGFFDPLALKNQVGIQNTKPIDTAQYSASEPIPYPDHPLLTKPPLRMIDTITILDVAGGPEGLGFIEGSKQVKPEEWFFAAHFYQDPVWPGSLGIEAFLQLLQVLALERWGQTVKRFEITNTRHHWRYRGQVIPANHNITVQAFATAIDDAQKTIRANGILAVDGLPIYTISDFELAAITSD